MIKTNAYLVILVNNLAFPAKPEVFNEEEELEGFCSPTRLY